MIELEGHRAHDLDTLIVGAVALATLTGQPLALRDIPRGLTAYHLAALRAFAPLCAAGVEGDEPRSALLRYVPSHPPRGQTRTIEAGGPAPITALVPHLLPVLARAEGDSLLTLRGTNAAPGVPSGPWLRELLTPTLALLGLGAAVEIERWGWHPDGGGELVVAVEGGWEAEAQHGSLRWEEAGDPLALDALVALSPNAEEAWGRRAAEALRLALAEEPLPPLTVELQRVQSPGPGSGLFVTLSGEMASAGFHAIRTRGEGADSVARRVAEAIQEHLWNDVALEPTLAAALLVPLALTRQPARFTTSAVTPVLRQMVMLVGRFLPSQVSTRAAHGRVTVDIALR